jgi:hypothetical protein
MKVKLGHRHLARFRVFLEHASWHELFPYSYGVSFRSFVIRRQEVLRTGAAHFPRTVKETH